MRKKCYYREISPNTNIYDLCAAFECLEVFRAKMDTSIIKVCWKVCREVLILRNFQNIAVMSIGDHIEYNNQI